MDAGVQIERTRLAWRRTGLAITVVALLAGRLAMTEGSGGSAFAAIAIIALTWVAHTALIRHRVRRLTRPAGRALPVAVLLILVYSMLPATLLMLSSCDY